MRTWSGGSAVGRSAVVAALTAGAVVAPALPAGAHTCLLPVRAAADEPYLIPIGVTAEAQPVDQVEVEVPAEVYVDALPPSGWRADRKQRTVVFSGGRIEPYACAFFTLRATPTPPGSYLLTLRLRNVDGSTIVQDQQERGETGGQLVLVGASSAGAPDDDGLGTGPTIAVGTGVGAVVLLAGVAALRHRRSARAAPAGRSPSAAARRR